MKTLKRHLIILIVLIVYFIFGHFTHLYIPCPFHTILHIYCPGCGITRLFISLFKLDFATAFRCNQLIFILLPFGIVLYINYIYSKIKNKKSWYDSIPIWIFYIIIVVLIVFGILRNFIPALAPIE